MIPYEEALEIVIGAAGSYGSETIPLTNATGRVLSEAITASFPLPRFDNSAVDGYAITGEDGKKLAACGEISVRLKGTSTAGASAGSEIQPGACFRVFTGAPLPTGTGGIVMQEDARAEGDCVKLSGEFEAGQHIRRAGEEWLEGDLVLPVGLELNSAGVALAAMLGRAAVAVRRLPRVSIVVTGSELVPPGRALESGQIHESNSFAIASALHQLGLTPVSCECVPDERHATEAAIERGLQVADVLITSGGVSVGEHDLVKAAFEGQGFERRFWQVAVKPGKPAYFGVRPGDGKAVFGLPGNPMSVLATFTLLVKPHLLAAGGHGEPRPQFRSAILKEGICHRPGRMEFVPSWLEDDSVSPYPGQGSHMLGGLARANALIQVPSGAEDIVAGSTVKVLPFGGNCS